MEFLEFPKIPRLNREIIATEKIDGTNTSICIVPSVGELDPDALIRFTHNGCHYDIFAGSRTRWITPDKDNFGFAAWVRDNVQDLITLGVGHHYGEWWGKGIQRGYGLEERRFSLFNVSRWAETRPACCHIVPVLNRGLDFGTVAREAIEILSQEGSRAASGYTHPEGVVLFHTAGNLLFKQTLQRDDEPKTSHSSGVTRIAGAV